MAKPKREIKTNDPLGLKINEVLRAKDMVGDYLAMSKWFEVSISSVYGWVERGTIRRDRLPALAEWSGKPVEWWVTDKDPEPSTTVYPFEAAVRTKWPFETISANDYDQLTERQKGQVEGFILGLIRSTEKSRTGGNQAAAAS